MLTPGLGFSVYFRSHLVTELNDETEPVDDPSRAYSAFNRLKSDPGRIGLARVEREIEKLGLIRDLD